MVDKNDERRQQAWVGDQTLTREAYQHIRRLGYWDVPLPKLWQTNPNNTYYPEIMHQVLRLYASTALVRDKEDREWLRLIGDTLTFKRSSIDISGVKKRLNKICCNASRLPIR